MTEELPIFEEPKQINGAEVVQQEPVVETQEPVEAIEPTVEERAKEFGWNPDYQGPNKKTAEEFLKFGEQRAPLLKKENDRLKEQMATMQKSYQNMMETSAATIKKQKEDNEKRIADLEVAKKDARENLDVEKLESVVNEQNALRDENKKLEQAAPPIDPTVTLWAQENEDYIKKVQSDPVLLKYQDAVALENREALLKLPPRARFEEIQRLVMQDMAHKFTNPNRDEAPQVNTTNRTPTMKKPTVDKFTLANLPKAEREAYDLIVKASRFKTNDEKKAFEERYLENYKLMTGSAV